MARLVRCSLTRPTNTDLAEGEIVAFRTVGKDEITYGISVRSEKHSYTLRMGAREADLLSRHLRGMLQLRALDGR